MSWDVPHRSIQHRHPHNDETEQDLGSPIKGRNCKFIMIVIPPFQAMSATEDLSELLKMVKWKAKLPSFIKL